MATWTFEPGHTAAEFCVRHMMVTFVRGHFKNIHGRLRFDADEPEKGSVEVQITAPELWTGEAERDAHLKRRNWTQMHAENADRGLTPLAEGHNMPVGFRFN